MTTRHVKSLQSRVHSDPGREELGYALVGDGCKTGECERLELDRMFTQAACEHIVLERVVPGEVQVLELRTQRFKQIYDSIYSKRRVGAGI